MRYAVVAALSSPSCPALRYAWRASHAVGLWSEDERNGMPLDLSSYSGRKRNETSSALNKPLRPEVTA
jgi:hypothetical protein